MVKQIVNHVKSVRKNIEWGEQETIYMDILENVNKEHAYFASFFFCFITYVLKICIIRWKRIFCCIYCNIYFGIWRCILWWWIWLEMWTFIFALSPFSVNIPWKMISKVDLKGNNVPAQCWTGDYDLLLLISFVALERKKLKQQISDTKLLVEEKKRMYVNFIFGHIIRFKLIMLKRTQNTKCQFNNVIRKLLGDYRLFKRSTLKKQLFKHDIIIYTQYIFIQLTDFTTSDILIL